MDTELASGIGIIMAALALLVAAAATEAGFWQVMTNRSRDVFDRDEDEPPPDLAWLRRNPVWFLAAVVTLKTALIVGAVGLAVASAMGHMIEGAPLFGLGAGLAVALILAQFLAYSVVLGSGEENAAGWARWARWLSYLMAPIAAPLSAVGNRLIGKQAMLTTEEEPRPLSGWTEDSSTEEARREDEGRQMVRGVLELEDTIAREVMAPRLDIVAVEVETPLDEVVSLIVSRGYSRIPLYEGTLDTIIGVIYAKDLLPALQSGNRPSDLRSLARPAYFIPETKRLADLLREFRASRVHLAIVVDEYGGTAGLVTIEDLLEEIVGEIEDEYDLHPHEQQLERLSEHEALVDARMSVDDFNEHFDLDLEGEDYDTVGGFVYTQLGRIPNVGDVVRVDGLAVSVVATAGRRIKRVRVERMNGYETDIPRDTAAAS